MAEKERGLTYAQAGVDIDAGNRMVELIKPLVRATARPGADAEIGGFGGLFDLKPLGFKDPVLVAANDGVGTKVKIACETAEMPGLYQSDDYDLAGFAVGAVERGEILPRRDIAEGDVIIGLASSGVHSNGFSLVRKVVAKSGLAW